MQETILVCDEHHRTFIPDLQSSKIKICPSAQFSLNGMPALIDANIKTLNRAVKLWRSIDHSQRTKSLVIARMQPGEKVPQHQAAGVAILPWCDDRQYADFFRLALLRPNLHVHPDWFYPRILHAKYDHHFERWSRIFSDLSEDDIVGMKNSDMMAKKLGCSKTMLRNRCNRLYGCSPGKMRRVLRIFLLTAICMRHEFRSRPGRKIRGKGSPLISMPGDFRRTLPRVFGISYSALRESSQHEHWAAVLMRAWREKQAGKGRNKMMSRTLSNKGILKSVSRINQIKA